MEELQMTFTDAETACTIPCVRYWAYFDDKYMGEIIAEDYNQYLKRNILTLITTAGTITKIRDPRGEITKWNLKICR